MTWFALSIVLVAYRPSLTYSEMFLNDLQIELCHDHAFNYSLLKYLSLVLFFIC